MASPPKSSFLDASDVEFLAQLESHAKFKQRTHDTHYNEHMPELTARLHLNPSLPEDKTGAHHVNPANNSPIHAIYLGNSHLERLETSGSKTQLHALYETGAALNAGVGGDKNENVIWRLTEGLYSILRTTNHNNNNNNINEIKVWLLVSGTNNIHPKHGIRPRDAYTWKLLLQACLRIAPRSRVLALDVGFRNDVDDAVVEAGNRVLEGVVREVNGEVRAWEGRGGRGGNGKKGREGEDREGGDRVVWVECRHLITRAMLDDHVHLNESGYEVLDRVVAPLVMRELGLEREKE